MVTPPRAPGCASFPLPGVYEGKLLKRMRALVDSLNASGVQHLDFGLCDAPMTDAQPGRLRRSFWRIPDDYEFCFFRPLRE